MVAELKTRLGAIELASSTIASPSPALVTAAVREGRCGSRADRAVDRRGHRPATDGLPPPGAGGSWPDVSDEALTTGIDSWLGPELSRIRGTRDLRRIDVLAALRRLLPWPEAGRLDELAPEQVRVPSGSAVRVDYEADQPVLAVRLQEVFGWGWPRRWREVEVPLLLHLLSPARRPAAVTADLRSFWRTGYPQVRAELRGRYPGTRGPGTRGRLRPRRPWSRGAACVQSASRSRAAAPRSPGR